MVTHVVALSPNAMFKRGACIYISHYLLCHMLLLLLFLSIIPVPFSLLSLTYTLNRTEHNTISLGICTDLCTHVQISGCCYACSPPPSFHLFHLGEEAGPKQVRFLFQLCKADGRRSRQQRCCRPAGSARGQGASGEGQGSGAAARSAKGCVCRHEPVDQLPGCSIPHNLPSTACLRRGESWGGADTGPAGWGSGVREF